MKPAVAAGLLALALAFAGTAAAEDGRGPEISAAAKAKPASVNQARQIKTKKINAKKTKAKPRLPVQPAHAGAPSGWRPADPSFDRQGRRYQPPPGLSCPVDLGYGRWGSCNDEN